MFKPIFGVWGPPTNCNRDQDIGLTELFLPVNNHNINPRPKLLHYGVNGVIECWKDYGCAIEYLAYGAINLTIFENHPPSMKQKASLNKSCIIFLWAWNLLRFTVSSRIVFSAADSSWCVSSSPPLGTVELIVPFLNVFRFRNHVAKSLGLYYVLRLLYWSLILWIFKHGMDVVKFGPFSKL